MRSSLRFPALVFASIVGLSACSEAADVELLEIDADGAIGGLAFIDENGNGQLDGNDEPLRLVDVFLTAGAGGQVITSNQTDTAGVFFFSTVPVGQYRLELAQEILGDSLIAVAAGSDVITVRRDDETQVNLGATFPTLTVEEVRNAVPGRRVFTTGIALNPRQSFGDGLVHIKGETLYLRATNVERGGLSTGDSVRFLGRTKVDNGQPILDDVTMSILVDLATIPVPVELTTSRAASADGGPLDAALARVRNAEIIDTLTVNGNFHFTVDDGSGPLEAVIRSFLQPNTTGFRPDTVVWARELTGLLVPNRDATGLVDWRIYVRGPGDINLQNKLVDVSVGLIAEPISASVGGTVVIKVVAQNTGQVRATGVQVADTVPAGLSLVNATTTRGSYSSATGIWVLDTLGTSVADTLTLTTTVAAGAPAAIVNRAWANRRLKEIDTNGGNDVATVIITVGASPPRP